jgi:hypothetical protein
VTESDPHSNRDPSDAQRPGLGKRVLEWFWRAESLARQRRLLPPAGEHAQLLARRARVSAEVASVAYTSLPLEPSHEAIASELYRQSAYWAACALLRDGPAPSVDAAAVWDALDERLLTPPEGGVATPNELRQLARTGSFAVFAELSADEQQRARLSLSQLTQTLLAKFDEGGAALKSIRAQRIWRLLLLSLLILGAVQGVVWARDPHWQRGELSAGKAWQLSSTYGIGGCLSPEQHCPGNTGYFFHTGMNDQSPWIEFDLASLQRVSTVQVENRQDCCEERAVPLTVEVSRDHQLWQSVARRDALFSTWSVSFDAVSARWVRLRVLKPSALHLHSVRIYP